MRIAALVLSLILTLSPPLFAGGSVDLEDIRPLLQQNSSLWNLFSTQLDINPHGGGVRLGAKDIPLRGTRVPPYEFFAKPLHESGPYTLKFIVNADFDFLDSKGNITTDEMKAVSIKQTLRGFSVEILESPIAR